MRCPRREHGGRGEPLRLPVGVRKANPAEETEKKQEENQEKVGSWKLRKENVLRGEVWQHL